MNYTREEKKLIAQGKKVNAILLQVVYEMVGEKPMFTLTDNLDRVRERAEAELAKRGLTLQMGRDAELLKLRGLING